MIPRTSNGCLSPILVVKTIVFFSFISCLSMVVAQNVRFFVEGQPPEPYGDFGYIRGLRIDLNNPPYFYSDDEILFSKDGKTLLEYRSDVTRVFDIPEGVTAIGDAAFKDSEIRGVVLPGTIERIGDEAFSGCEYMTSMIVPKSVKSIGKKAFWNCNRLETAVVAESVEA